MNFLKENVNTKKLNEHVKLTNDEILAHLPFNSYNLEQLDYLRETVFNLSMTLLKSDNHEST